MRKAILLFLVAWAAMAYGAEVAIESYDAGELKLVVKGAGTATIVAQADYAYVSAKTGADAIARAESKPLKVSLTAAGVPVTITFGEPAGSITTVDVTVYVDGKEAARQGF